VSVVGGVQPTYDANGNLTNDTVQTYTWDSDGNLVTVGGVGLTFDALDRMVEQKRGSIYTQIVYGTLGNKLALMNGQTLARAFVPLSAGATAVYNSSSLAYYRHSDWLGSSRFASTPGRALYYDGAYAPYGENYAETGTQDRDFTGENQDTINSGPYPLYDFLRREHHATWGRWVSPDPAGLGAADAANPQSWNRYVYVLNEPCLLVDHFGLQTVCTLVINLTANNLIGNQQDLEKQVEDRVESMLAQAQVGVTFSSSNADFTIALLPADPNASAHANDVWFGSTPNPSKPYSQVYQQQIASEIHSTYPPQPGDVGFAMGTMAVHELTTHALPGQSTFPGSAAGTVNQENGWYAHMMMDKMLGFYDPKAVQDQCKKIRKKKPLPPQSGGGGPGGYDMRGLYCLIMGCTPYPIPEA
jgi:RHS repeat-associated protein